MPTAVLLSGGLDSAVLARRRSRARGDRAADLRQRRSRVGGARSRRSSRGCSPAPTAALGDRVRPLVSLAVDMRDVYAATHWAIEGRPPGYHTPDEDVYLPGRNIVLLGKAAVYCAAAGIDRLVLGTLAHNPFPDATPEFRSAMAGALSLGLAHPLHDRRAVRGHRARRTSSARRRARRAVRADAVVHEPAPKVRSRVEPSNRPHRALRHVQQVPRTSRRLSRSRTERSDRVRDNGEFALKKEQEGWKAEVSLSAFLPFSLFSLPFDSPAGRRRIVRAGVRLVGLLGQHRGHKGHDGVPG